MTALVEPVEPVPFCVTEPSTLWVGGRPFAWAQLKREDLPAPHTFATRQAILKFENGWDISIVWGSCTYSSNHDHGISNSEFTETPDEVEVAIIGPKGMLGGDVAPYLTPVQVLAIIDAVATWPTAGPKELPVAFPFSVASGELG